MVGLSVKTHYALLAMLDLAEHAQESPIQLRLIVDRYQLPHNYLEQAMVALKQDGLVLSVRGSQGGYRLAKSSHDITVLQIIEAVEGQVSFVKSDNECCEALDFFWESVDSSLHTTLSVSLHEVLQDKLAKKGTLTYII